MPPHDCPIRRLSPRQSSRATCDRHVLFVKCPFDGPDQVAYSLRGGAARRRYLFRLSLDLAKEVHADSLVDFRFRCEEAIDIGGGHVQLACDIGDCRLLETDLPEQAFRYLDNQLMIVLFLGFRSARIV